MEQKKNKNKFIILLVVILIITVISIVLKVFILNNNEVPFEISKIIVVSGLRAEDKEDEENLFNLNLIQSNDIYINISSSKNNNEQEFIDKVTIGNFYISNVPTKGNIHIYRPNDETGRIKNSTEYQIEDSWTLIGDDKNDFANLKISNQGGIVLLNCSNEYLVNYVSNDDSIVYDGSLFKKVGVTKEEIEFEISFDISIELKSGKKYKTILSLEMPTGDVIEQGTVSTEINADDILFKEY